MNFEAAAKVPESHLQDLNETSHKAQGAHEAQEDIMNEGGSADLNNEPDKGPETDAKEPGAQAAGKKNLKQALGDKGGKVATQLMDLLIPVTVALIVSLFGRKVNAEKLRLTKEEKELFAPAWDQVLETFFVDENNPWFMLALVGGVIYTAKIIEVFPDIKKVVSEVTINPSEKDHEPAMPVKKSFDELYAIAYDELVTETLKQRKKGDEEAKAYLKKTGSFDRLKEKVQLKYEQQ